MKRFTDTEKWSDPWFRKLSSPAKQLWGYVLDHCDKIGLVEIDLALAGDDCGQQINQTHLDEIMSRLESLGSGKFFIPKFINFQYGELTPACPPHRTILKMVAVHGLIRDGLLYHYPSVRVTSQVVDCQQKPYPSTTLALGHKTRQEEEKTRQEKELSNYRQIDARAGALFGRTEPATTYAEQAAISEISRRPNAIDELAEIEVFHRKPENYFPQSMQKLLSTWQETLDRARTHETRKNQNGNNRPTHPNRNAGTYNAKPLSDAAKSKIR